MEFLFEQNKNFVTEINQLENILKNTYRTDDFKQFKNFLSLITDDILKNYLLSLFTNLVSNTKQETSFSYVENFKVYIKELVENSLINNTEEHYLNMFCVMEINYLILYSLCKNINYKTNFEKEFLSEVNINNQNNKISYTTVQSPFLYTNKTDDDTLLNDLYLLINISEYFDKTLSPFLKFLADFNSLIKTKEFFSFIPTLDKKCSSFNNFKLTISNFEYFLDIVFFSLKFIFNPTNDLIESNLNINVDNFSKMIKEFFTIIFEYLIINYKTYESIINDKLANLPYFENYLMLSAIIDSTVTEIKLFPEEDKNSDTRQLLDFGTFFQSFSENFVIFFYTTIKYKIITKLNDFIYIIENIHNFDRKKFNNFYIPPYLLNIANEGINDFITSHITASFINENTFEMYLKNFWMKVMIECFCFSSMTEKLYKVIITYFERKDQVEKNIVKKENICLSTSVNVGNNLNEEMVKIIEQLLLDSKINLPIKLMFFKEVFTLTNLVIINYLLIKLPILSEKLKENCSTLNSIEEYKNYQNKFFFVLCSNIQKLLLKENYYHKLRLYGYDKFPLDYYEVTEFKKTNKRSSQNVEMEVISLSQPAESHSNLTNPLVINHKSKEDEAYIDMSVDKMLDYHILNKENWNHLNMIENVAMVNYSSNFNNPDCDNFNRDFQKRSSCNSKSKQRKSANNTKVISNEVNNNDNLTIKFDITSVMKNFDFNQLKALETHSGKKISVTNNKNNSIILKCKIKNNPSSIVLIQKDNSIGLFDEVSYSYNVNGNLISQSSMFLKELLSIDMISKNDIEYLTQLDYEQVFASMNFLSQNENLNNSMINFFNTFKYYDLKEELSYYDIIENIIKLLN